MRLAKRKKLFDDISYRKFRVAKQISGHKTDSIFNRYDIVSVEAMREGLLKTQRHLKSGHNRGTFQQRG